jgi:hypothetical protein
MRRHLSLLAAAFAVAAIACADQGAPATGLRTTTGPDSGSRSDSSVRHDTSTRHDSSATVDTTVGSKVPGVHGRVFAWQSTATDTGIYVAIAGAKVELVITPIDSLGPGDTAIVVGSTTAASDGTFLIDPVPDGWYAVRATPPAGTSARAGIVYGVTVKGDLMTNFRDVNVYLPMP